MYLLYAQSFSPYYGVVVIHKYLGLKFLIITNTYYNEPHHHRIDVPTAGTSILKLNDNGSCSHAMNSLNLTKGPSR